MFISHVLNNTGAPLILMDAINACVNNGYSIDVVSLEDGILRDRLQEKGISVTIADNFLDELSTWQMIFKKYDVVIANTMLCVEAIYVLNTTGVPTIWWIHEHEAWFEAYKTIMPKKEELKANIHIFGVSPVTNKLIKDYFDYDTEVLPFGIEDKKSDFAEDNTSDGKVRFILPATFSYVKGQDLVCEAVRELSEDIRSKCFFTMCGAQMDGQEEYYESLTAASKELGNIEIKGALSHDEVLRLMAESDYVLAPSRMEPFSATAVEAMMMGIVPVISNICGAAYYLTSGSDSLIFETENVVALKNAIGKAVNIRLSDKAAYEAMVKSARNAFENTFSMEAFRNRFISLLDKMGNSNSHSPKVSIIVPAYNSHNTLARCLGSLVNQTLQDIEIIVVNDASTDDTYEIMKRCQAQFPGKVRIIDGKVNRGSGGARNQGIDIASGEYIGFVDSDDYVAPNMYELLYDKASSEKCDIVDCGYFDEALDKAILLAGDNVIGSLDDEKRSILVTCGGYLFTKIFRRELFNTPRIRMREKVRCLEDAEIITYMLLRAEKIGNVKEVLYNYCDMANSASKQIDSDIYFSSIKGAMNAIFDICSGLSSYEGARASVEYTILVLYSSGINRCIYDAIAQNGASESYIDRYFEDIAENNKMKLLELAQIKKRVISIDYDNNSEVLNRINKLDIEIMKECDRRFG